MIYLAIALVWVASLVVVGVWQNKVAKNNDEVVKELNEDLKIAKGWIKSREAKIKDMEIAHDQATLELTTYYEVIMQSGKELHEKDVAAIRLGTSKLYDPAIQKDRKLIGD